MTSHTSTANILGRVLLFPGDVACNAMGLQRDDKRDLVRMLVNSLVWIVVGMVAAVIVA
jgi:heme/copper-type cytochrome/quinol oxidase subunit 2